MTNKTPMTQFEKSEIFQAKMVEDLRNGILKDTVYQPYINWKLDKIKVDNISFKEAQNMLLSVSDDLELYYEKYPNAYIGLDKNLDNDPWQLYKGFGKDKYIVSYLEQIDNELTNIIGILR